MNALTPSTATSFQVHFGSLFVPGRGLVFPCDAQGHVDMDTLTDRARSNYLFARAMVGRDYAAPHVCEDCCRVAEQTPAVRLR